MVPVKKNKKVQNRLRSTLCSEMLKIWLGIELISNILINTYFTWEILIPPMSRIRSRQEPSSRENRETTCKKVDFSNFAENNYNFLWNSEVRKAMRKNI